MYHLQYVYGTDVGGVPQQKTCVGVGIIGGGKSGAVMSRNCMCMAWALTLFVRPTPFGRGLALRKFSSEIERNVFSEARLLVQVQVASFVEVLVCSSSRRNDIKPRPPSCFACGYMWAFFHRAGLAVATLEREQRVIFVDYVQAQRI